MGGTGGLPASELVAGLPDTARASRARTMQEVAGAWQRAGTITGNLILLASSETGSTGRPATGLVTQLHMYILVAGPEAATSRSQPPSPPGDGAPRAPGGWLAGLGRTITSGSGDDPVVTARHRPGRPSGVRGRPGRCQTRHAASRRPGRGRYVAGDCCAVRKTRSPTGHPDRRPRGHSDLRRRAVSYDLSGERLTERGLSGRPHPVPGPRTRRASAGQRCIRWFSASTTGTLLPARPPLRSRTAGRPRRRCTHSTRSPCTGRRRRRIGSPKWEKGGAKQRGSPVKIREPRVAIAIFGSMLDLAFGYRPPGASFFVLMAGGRTLIGTPPRPALRELPPAVDGRTPRGSAAPFPLVTGRRPAPCRYNAERPLHSRTGRPRRSPGRRGSRRPVRRRTSRRHRSCPRRAPPRCDRRTPRRPRRSRPGRRPRSHARRGSRIPPRHRGPGSDAPGRAVLHRSAWAGQPSPPPTHRATPSPLRQGSSSGCRRTGAIRPGRPTPLD